MRTTLAIDDDVLAAAKSIARHRGKTVGEVLSDLARKSLHPTGDRTERNGVPLLPVRDPNALVTLDFVNALRDELP
jgi:hypothetical protein